MMVVTSVSFDAAPGRAGRRDVRSLDRVRPERRVHRRRARIPAAGGRHHSRNSGEPGKRIAASGQ